MRCCPVLLHYVFDSIAARDLFSGFMHGVQPNCRQERLRQATPSWADKEAIKAKYAECRRLNKENGPRTHCVDHIIPLRGDAVSGLHVENNLRVVPSWINARKQNRFNGKRKNSWKFYFATC